MSISLKGLIRSDLERYSQTYKLRGQAYSKWRVAFESFVFKAGFQAVLLYRVSHWFYRIRFTGLAWLLARLNVTLTGAEIEFNAEIGPGMFISHPVGIVIGRGTRIGSGATLFQGVSFGVKSWHPDDIKKFPKVGNNCFFFAHAVILGDVTIGDNCVVAAQAVVTKDMPDGYLAKGVPAEIYSEKGQEVISSWSY
ncbi:MAG: serine O-acetyltransferase [Candidatus Omnitrophica bacterium]|nr:serine O-acetyltransferase [Candidatus Omnitrophota bacterium]